MNTVHNKVGFDLDGVIASERELRARFFELFRDEALRQHCQRHAQVLRRPSAGVIISCRPESERALTTEWLRDSGIDLPLILCQNAREKALHINRLRLGEFSENCKRIAEELQSFCPATRIILSGEVRR